MNTLIHKSLLVLLFACWASNLLAQFTTVHEQQIDVLLEPYLQPNSPGCAVGVIQYGKLVYSKGFGLANIELGTPITPDTEFCIGSMTKQFTAMCIGLLVQAGKINLDDDIRSYLPEFAHYDQGVTIRHLLHHTSGIRDYGTLLSITGATYKRFTTYDETMPLLSRQLSLNFPPNTKHLYSNSGFLLLQEIVRRISGQSLQEFANETIFVPLNMNHSFFNADFNRLTNSQTISYWQNGDGTMIPFKEQVGGVSNELIQTTLKDLVNWDQNFYHSKVGGKEWIKMLQKPGVLESGDTINYAFGLQVGDYKGMQYVTHGGGNLGFGSDMIRFPEHQTTIIVLSNSTIVNQRALMYTIADIVLSKSLVEPSSTYKPVSTVKLSKSELTQYCGPYWNTKIDEARFIYFRDDTIRYNRPDRYESPLVPIGNHEFKMLNRQNEQTASTVRFVLNNNAPNELFFRSADGSESYSYQFEEVKPTKNYLSQFEGTYTSNEIDFSFNVGYMDKKLYLITKEKLRNRLYPNMADHFIDQNNRKITFVRNSSDQITGFTMDLSRVKGLIFHKT